MRLKFFIMSYCIVQFRTGVCNNELATTHVMLPDKHFIPSCLRLSQRLKEGKWLQNLKEKG